MTFFLPSLEISRLVTLRQGNPAVLPSVSVQQVFERAMKLLAITDTSMPPRKECAHGAVLNRYIRADDGNARTTRFE